jgi:integrase
LAKDQLGKVARGVDPAEEKAGARKDITVAELCELYLAEGCATKKASTIYTDRGRILRHIIPLLGRKRIKNVTREDVERFLVQVAEGKTAVDEKTGKHGRARVTGGKGVASKSVILLGAIFSFAGDRRLVTENPVRGVKRYQDGSKERYLSPAELGHLGDALALATNEHSSAITALRLLALSGCRKSEILGLRWEWVDFERSCLVLPDSKTGRKIVPLGAPALELLASLPRLDPTLVCPGLKPGMPFVGLRRVWKRICATAGIGDARLHDLRHSYASMGASGGDSLLMIGKLLGHRKASTTQKYAHLADDPVKATADRIAGKISAAMKGGRGAEVIEIPKRA